MWREFSGVVTSLRCVPWKARRVAMLVLPFSLAALRVELGMRVRCALAAVACV